MTDIGLHSVTGRPTWRGLVVPYLTVWSGEQIDLTKRPFAYLTGDDGRERLSIAHTEGSALAADRVLLEQRDGFGLLWFSGLNNPGVGEPLWAQVHGLRQRECMVGRHCQVCGNPFPSGRPVTFLVPEQDVPKDCGPFETPHPPVCDTCRPWSLMQCPHLREQATFVWVTARAYRPTSVLADLYIRDRQTLGISEDLGVTLPLGHDLLRYAVVKQLLVTIRGYTVERAQRTGFAWQGDRP
ncbi:hypothetical protein [Nocardia sp. NRRL S-836]|uniref:hypothetical protein n=1 Tax=Nocardia sp. NRRL S-836 TaxID=1519492 RepID=UPI0006ADE6D3|nr:hypothetical protein [Nocardia sp. NRRL S-836]